MQFASQELLYCNSHLVHSASPRITILASMAVSYSFYLNPISHHPHIAYRLHTPRLMSRNLSLQRTRYHHFGAGSIKQPMITIVCCSYQTEDSTNQAFNVPILTSSEAIEKLRANPEKQNRKQQYLAMYSSIFGGIITDPAAMLIPIDDHMVHRGHGVFDTAAIMDGHLYELDQHVDRILRSASLAKIDLPFDRETIRRILIQTVIVSKCEKGSLRYWLSAGPGDFQLSPSGCHQPALYAIVIQDQSPLDSKGVKVVTSSVPIKPPQFATMKSVNYLPNVLSKMEAEDNGAFAAIWLDDEGFIAEGPNMNVAFVTKEKELVMPRFDKILSGCTAKRVLTLAEGLVRVGKLHGVKVDNVTVEEGKSADEMMLIGSGILVRPIVQWDEQLIGDGKEGPITLSLLNLILEDMKCGPATVRVSIP